MGRPKKATTKKGREGPRKKSTAKASTPKKQDPDQPIQSTEEKTLPDAPTKEEHSMTVEPVDMTFPDEWQNFLSFPMDDKDSMLYA